MQGTAVLYAGCVTRFLLILASCSAYVDHVALALAICAAAMALARRHLC
eukprot:COSAG01_NODE_32763_length_575_cov_7.318991_1_plen_48_part_10